MRTFLWLALYDAVMTNVVKVKRGFASNAHGSICLDMKEDNDHILRDCEIAQAVWHHFQQTNQGVHLAGTSTRE